MGRRRSTKERTGQAQLVGDALDALQVGILVLDATDAPVLANPTAYALGLVRGEDAEPPRWPEGARAANRGDD